MSSVPSSSKSPWEQAERAAKPASVPEVPTEAKSTAPWEPRSLLEEVRDINAMGTWSWRKTLGFSNFQAVLSKPMEKHHRKLAFLLHPDKAKSNPQYAAAGGHEAVIRAFHLSNGRLKQDRR